MKTYYIGLDLHCTTSWLAVMDTNGKIIDACEIPTTGFELIKEIKKVQGNRRVILEESSLAQWAFEVINPHVNEIVVSDPKHNFWISRSKYKDDRMDAERLAELLRIDHFKPVFHSLNEERIQFKKSVIHYHDMVNEQKRLKNKIKARFLSSGIRARGSSVYSPAGRKEFLDKIESNIEKRRIVVLYEILDHMLELKGRAYQSMIQLSRKFPEVKRFQKIPGVGPVIACSFSGIIQTPARFKKKEQVWAYSRLAVRKKGSNKKQIGRICLSREGVGLLKDISRKAFIAAMGQSKDNEIRRYFYDRGRLGDTRARLSTQRKIIAIMFGIWKNDKEYNPEMV